MSDPDAENVAGHTAQPRGDPQPPLQAGGSTTEHKETNAGSSKHKCRRKLREAPKWIEAACALVLIGITGYYAYYAHQQAAAAIQAAQAASDNALIAYWALMGNQESSAFTLGQMQGQTAAQERAANAAIGANKVTREALVSVQRAFVSFSGTLSATKIVKHDKTTDLMLNLPWTNLGTTPTRKSKSRVNWQTFPQGMPDNFSFLDIGDVAPRQFTIPSKGFGNATMEVPIQVLEYVKDGNLRLFVWGWITYHDIFERTPVRLSEFCDEVTNIKSSTDSFTDPASNITWELVLCSEHNCTDEECRDYKEKTKGK